MRDVGGGNAFWRRSYSGAGEGSQNATALRFHRLPLYGVDVVRGQFFCFARAPINGHKFNTRRVRMRIVLPTERAAPSRNTRRYNPKLLLLLLLLFIAMYIIIILHNNII